MKVTFRIWRQDNPGEKGGFKDYEVSGLNADMSFLEALPSVGSTLHEWTTSPGKLLPVLQQAAPVVIAEQRPIRERNPDGQIARRVGHHRQQQQQPRPQEGDPRHFIPPARFPRALPLRLVPRSRHKILPRAAEMALLLAQNPPNHAGKQG